MVVAVLCVESWCETGLSKMTCVCCVGLKLTHSLSQVGLKNISTRLLSLPACITEWKEPNKPLHRIHQINQHQTLSDVFRWLRTKDQTKHLTRMLRTKDQTKHLTWMLRTKHQTKHLTWWCQDLILMLNIWSTVTNYYIIHKSKTLLTCL